MILRAYLLFSFTSLFFLDLSAQQREEYYIKKGIIRINGSANIKVNYLIADVPVPTQDENATRIQRDTIEIYSDKSYVIKVYLPKKLLQDTTSTRVAEIPGYKILRAPPNGDLVISENVSPKTGRLKMRDTTKRFAKDFKIQIRYPILNVVKGRTRDYLLTSRWVKVNPSGSFSIQINDRFQERNDLIQILDIPGFQNGQDLSDISSIDVWPVTRYKVILKGRDQSRITPKKGYLKMGDLVIPLNNRGEGVLSSIIDPKELPMLQFKVVLEGNNNFKGVFDVYNVIHQFGRKKSYWRRVKGTIAIVLPFINNQVKYLVKNKKNKILSNHEFTLTYNRNIVKTDENGYLYIKMILNDDLIRSSDNEKVKVINSASGRIIEVDKEIKTEKELALEKVVRKLEEEKLVIEKERQQLFTDLTRLSREKTVSQQQIEQLNKKIQNLQNRMSKSLSDFKRELLGVLLPDNMALRKKYQLKSDTSLSITTFKELIEELDKKEKARNEAKIKLERKKQELEKTRVLFWKRSVIILCITLAFIIWFFIRQRNANQRLSVVNSKLIANELLVKLLINELNHRVANELRTLKSTLERKANRIQNRTLKKILNQAAKQIKKLEDVQYALDYSVLYRERQEKLSQDKVKFKVQEIARAICDFYAENQITTLVKTDIESIEKKKFMLIGVCVFELVHNACKYAFEFEEDNFEPKIEINLKENDGFFVLEVINNGNGFIKELFDNEKKELNFKGLDEGSRGMHIIQQITEVENGLLEIQTVDIHSDINEGSCIKCFYQIN